MTVATDVLTVGATLLRLDATGGIVWQRSYDSRGLGQFQSVRATPDGGAIAVGATSASAWVVKVDALGNVVWQKTYHAANEGQLFSVRVTADGGYVVAGETIASGDGDVLALRLDALGHVVWQRSYDGAGYDKCLRCRRRPPSRWPRCSVRRARCCCYAGADSPASD